MNSSLKVIGEKTRFVAMFAIAAALALVAGGLTACGDSSSEATPDNEVLIYTSVEDYVIEDMQQRLSEEFPEYDITVEYVSTGNHAAKLLTEGTNTACDISYDLEYPYMAQVAEAGVLMDLSQRYDTSIYTQDMVQSNNYLPQCRVGGGIILNMDVINAKGLDVPTSYEDLLDPQYEGLISMPNPKSSGTGYMFLYSLAEAWGDEAAIEYFDNLTPNILQYTESGSGPVNALLAGEAAIGLGMTGQAVVEINNGANFQVVYFEEGSPCTFYGMGVVEGRQDDLAVMEVFDFLQGVYGYELNEKFFPEKIFNDKTYVVENYPTDITYASTDNNTGERKEQLLAQWKY